MCVPAFFVCGGGDISYLKFTQLLESVVLYLLPNLGSFHSLFLQSFQLHSLLSYWDFKETNAGYSLTVPQAGGPIHYFSVCFVIVVQIG